MSVNPDFKTPGRFTMFNKSFVGNYDESLSDAKAAHQLQPTFIRAIERGKFLTEEVFLRSLFGDPGPWAPFELIVVTNTIIDNALRKK